MKRNTTLLAALITAASLVTPALAAPRAEMSSNIVDFRVESTYRSLTLRVSGADFDFEQTFDASQPALFAPAEHGLADGTYTYELVVNPFAPDVENGERIPDLQVTSGAFTVSAGALVDPSISERAGQATTATETGGLQGVEAAAQVFTQDLIVQGSSCVGVDCASSESFSFDTFRLKENNLRIHFDDTSASANFPGNDWRLVANDSSNGGANRFSIEDATAGRSPFTIEAGAIVNALYVDSEGDVGVGTATPVVEVHAVDGNSPTLRLEQNGSNGFQAQTWDIAGNEANFFVRDVTNGSKLPFKIKPGAPDDAIFIAASGSVGFSDDNPSGDIEVSDTTGNVDVDLTTAGQSWRIRANSGNNQLNFIDNTGSKTPLRIFNGANSNLLIVGGSNNSTADADQVTVTGDLQVTGTCNGCDAVFTPEWDLETIEEHASFMWSNSYLPGVGPTEEGDTSINVFEKTTGILQELEKAHIYIDQLNGRIGDLSGELEAKDSAIETLTERLDRLEKLLANQ